MTDITFWGLTASPYQLKMQSLADAAGANWRRWPEQANALQAIGMNWRMRRARKAGRIDRLPQRDVTLDEYPAVPYYSIDGGPLHYDSTGLALHLEQLSPDSKQPLIPKDPPLRFICQLIDEAFDEFGLYMVHHNRWITSAATNSMGDFTTREISRQLPRRLHQHIATTFAERQVRRCPYLFSVAPTGFEAGVRPELTPPDRPGFPQTHDILNSAWRRYLEAMEGVLQQQPFLMGDRFSLADASAYGQLSMNLVDGRAAELLEELAPVTFRWLCMIRDGGHKGVTGELRLNDQLTPLLNIIGETFVPLMQQNERAYHQMRKEGQTLFNEAAFDKGEALYDGTLLGMPFRAVAKTFQLPVWQDIRQSWQGLEASQREQLHTLSPLLTDATFSSVED